jgi:hypothetical protein
MTAGTRWTISVEFSANSYTNQNAICYQVIDTSKSNSAMGWNSASDLNSYQNAFPAKSPNSSYLSFSETFELSGSSTGTCKVVITGGTYCISTI